MNMSKFLALCAISSAMLVTGCGVTPYVKSPDTVIARGYDGGLGNRGTLQDGGAGIAYDPDGCQGWILDDGIEGYSGRRFDPATGLPICNNLYPPGTVLRNYQTPRAGLRDWTPTTGIQR